jgi:trimeric autotransporter adhesin
MSTKTTFKRIALVAVASLGFGVLTSIAPASAGQSDNANITVGALTATNASGRVGVGFSATSAWSQTTGAGTDTVTVASAIASAPAGSTATVSQAFAATSGSPTYAAPTVTKVTSTGTIASWTMTYSFTPDVVGSYTLMTWADQNTDGYLSTGEAFKSTVVTVVANADAVTAAITSYNTTAPTSAANGILAKITITNSAAAAASLSAGEVITASVSGAAKIGGSSGTASVQLNRASFDGKGRAWINIYNATAESVTLSVTGTVGPSVTAISQTAGYTFAAAAGELATAAVIGNAATQLTGVKAGTAQVKDTTSGTMTVDPLKTTTVALSTTTTAVSVVVPYTIKDVSGRITGLANALYDSYTTAGTAGAVAFSAPAFTPVASGDNYQVVVGATGVAAGVSSNNKVTVTATAARPAASTDVTKDQAATLRVVKGSAVTVSAVWKDGFGVAIPNEAVTVTVTGRNAHLAVQNSVTDASGRVTFTYTDAPLTGVSATADTISFDGNSSADTAFTVNVVTSYGVSAVAINTPDTTAGVNNVVKATPSAINAGSTGASGSTVSISADVTDAAGATYAGIPVTFTISGTGAAILSTKVTTYTDAAGNATSSVYGWVAGTYTITATADGKTSTGLISFASTTASNARIVTATVDGNVVTGKVVDRFGNPVSGVTLYATTTKPANIGGTFVSGVATGSAGTSSWVVSGNGSVTVSAVNPSDPAGTTFGQTCAAATKTSCATTAVALTAATAGTATTAEKNVGNDQAPAGVASATVEVSVANASEAAADAAAEATDAANAATDAANAAAEAADAATAAAQDAADAVAALSTQVSEMVDALKKQITALTNLVIKIQKKVRA